MPSRIEHVFKDGVEKKRCGKCHEYKPLSEFHKTNNTWDGLYYLCKDCLNHIRNDNPLRIAADVYSSICRRVRNDICYTQKGVKVKVTRDDFIKWYIKGWFKGCVVDRKDNQGHYKLSNLQFITHAEHNHKRRQDHLDFLDIKELEGKRYCFTCSTLQPETEFYTKQLKISKMNIKGLDECCKECCRKKRREYYTNKKLQGNKQQ